jgi:uncharacterized repeat protein (TIGR01451 family)
MLSTPRRLAVLAVSLVLGACFPDLTGAPCDGDRQCPTWQTCHLNVCVDGARPERAVTMSASGSLGVAAASVSQPLTLTVTVRNTGTVGLISVTPMGVVSSGTATEQISSGPSPASVDALALGATATFTWTLQPLGAGTLSLGAGLRGIAADDPGDIASATAPISLPVQRPPSLEVTSFTAPGVVNRGQTFPASMVVANRGDATATGVAPDPLEVTATGGAAVSAATPPAAQDIPGGQTATFQWMITENGTAAGTVRLSAGASGKDANTAATVASSAPGMTEVITVQ